MGIGALLLLLLAFVTADLAYDWRKGTPSSHFAAEIAAALLLGAGIALVGGRLLQAQAHARNLARDLDALRDAERRRDESRQDVGEDARSAALREFEAWGLTAAERDVGLLLLQGLRHKEIAHARRTSERTVRQQALSVYRKAGVEGRSELAAYFLDRLLRARRTA